MAGFDKYAAYYRGYLADDRRLASVVGFLLAAIALWLLVYLVSLVGPASQQRLRLGEPPARAARAATVMQPWSLAGVFAFSRPPT